MQQTPVPSTPSPPAIPGIAPPAAAPRTASALAQLRARRSELSGQLKSLETQRERLVERLARTGDPTARTGLVDRLAEVDKRIMQIDQEVADVGRQISQSGADLVASTATPSPPPPSSGSDDEGPIIVSSLLIVFVLFPLTIAFVRRIWKRTPSGPPVPREWNDMPQRMERIEHAIDAVAIEVERVSEGQRFVTRLMTENGLPSAVAAVRASADAARTVAEQSAEPPELKALGAGERPFEPINADERAEARLRGAR